MWIVSLSERFVYWSPGWESNPPEQFCRLLYNRFTTGTYFIYSMPIVAKLSLNLTGLFSQQATPFDQGEAGALGS